MRHAQPATLLPFLLAALPAQGLADKVDELSRPLIAAEVAIGFVVGVIDGDTTLVRGYGTLERGKDGAPTGDTLYEIGSISKVFTGLLLADAVERGLCKLDDPVQQFLPEGVTLRKWRDQPVLLWHLSTHTSGLPRLAGMEGGDDRNPYAHFDEAHLHEALGEANVRWEPGTKYEYSNLAVGLLGYVLGRMNGGASYDELLTQRLTGPLQMRDTAVVLSPALRERLAPPHDGEGDPAQTWDLAMLAGAGGIRSSVHDMVKFARLQLAPGDSPLAKAVVLSQQKRHDGANGLAFGLGWHFARDGVTRWHTGQTGGYHGYLGVVPGKARAVCVLTNTGNDAVDAVGERILQHLFGMKVEPPKHEVPVAVDRALLQRLVGKYRMSPAMQFDITLGERGLAAQLTGQPAFCIHPRSPTEFFYRAVVASITFDLDGEAVKGLVLHQNGKDLRCRRLEEPAAK